MFQKCDLFLSSGDWQSLYPQFFYQSIFLSEGKKTGFSDDHAASVCVPLSSFSYIIAPSYSHFSKIGNSDMADAQTCEVGPPLALLNIGS
jgi:hypothetical protein